MTAPLLPSTAGPTLLSQRAAGTLVRRLHDSSAQRLRATGAVRAWTAVVPRVGPDLAQPGEVLVDLGVGMAADGLTTSAGRAVPVQRFDIPVPSGFPGHGELLWSGEPAVDRHVCLDVWNTRVGRWERLDEEDGRPHAATLLSGTVTEEHVDTAATVVASTVVASGVVHARVHGVDLFVRTGRAPAVDFLGLRDPATYDVALAHLGGTATALRRACRAPDPDSRDMWRDVVGEAARWVGAEASRRRVAHVLHTPGAALRPEEEALSGRLLAPLRASGLAVDGGGRVRTHLVDTPHWRAVVVHLEDRPDADADADAHARAREALARHRDRDAVLVVGDYLRPSPRDDARGARRTPAGEETFREVVAHSENVVLVLASVGPGVGTAVVREAGGRAGHHVVELLADFSAHALGGEAGLTGFLRLLQIDVRRSEMTVSTYSPFLEDGSATRYDPRARHDVTTDTFTVPLALRARTTTLSTGAMLLIDRPSVPVRASR